MDIVERLRRGQCGWDQQHELMNEAADEIERLRRKNASAASCQHGYRYYVRCRLAAGDVTFGKGKQPRQRQRLGEPSLSEVQAWNVEEGFDPPAMHTWQNYLKNWEDGVLPDDYDPINHMEYVTRGEVEHTDRSRDI